MKTAVSISAMLLTLGATYADSVNLAAPLSVSSSSNSPTLTTQDTYEIQTSTSMSFAVLNSEFISLSTGVRYGISDYLNFNVGYSIQDYSKDEAMWQPNNAALRNTQSHHLFLGVQSSIIPRIITTYLDIGQGYNPKTLSTDASFGLNIGYSNDYLTPYMNIEYGYSLPYNQTWVLDSDSASFSELYRAGNTHFAGFKLGLETQFGNKELGLKLFSAISTSLVSTTNYSKKDLNRVNNNLLFSINTGLSYQL